MKTSPVENMSINMSSHESIRHFYIHYHLRNMPVLHPTDYWETDLWRPAPGKYRHLHKWCCRSYWPEQSIFQVENTCSLQSACALNWRCVFPRRNCPRSPNPFSIHQLWTVFRYGSKERPLFIEDNWDQTQPAVLMIIWTWLTVEQTHCRHRLNAAAWIGLWWLLVTN